MYTVLPVELKVRLQFAMYKLSVVHLRAVYGELYDPHVHLRHTLSRALVGHFSLCSRALQLLVLSP